jgi:hypothetical protein
MKKEILEITQHVNAVLAVVFCVVYSFLNCHLYIVVGVILGGAALFFIYLPDIITIPGVLQEEKQDSKKISIVAGWCFVFWLLGITSESNLLKGGGVLLFFLLALLFTSYVRKFKRKSH